jgi:chitodextrinase
VLALNTLGKRLDASFLLHCTDAPRTHAEAIAARVFATHTAAATFDRAKSGAEWWFQVRAPDEGATHSQGGAAVEAEAEAAAAEQDQEQQQEQQQQPQEGEEEEEEEEEEMRGETIMFHWDKDEVL